MISMFCSNLWCPPPGIKLFLAPDGEPWLCLCRGCRRLDDEGWWRSRQTNCRAPSWETPRLVLPSDGISPSKLSLWPSAPVPFIGFPWRVGWWCLHEHSPWATRACHTPAGWRLRAKWPDTSGQGSWDCPSGEQGPCLHCRGCAWRLLSIKTVQIWTGNRGVYPGKHTRMQENILAAEVNLH